jgi:hypothetical protein
MQPARKVAGSSLPAPIILIILLAELSTCVMLVALTNRGELTHKRLNAAQI